MRVVALKNIKIPVNILIKRRKKLIPSYKQKEDEVEL